jgi:hypothetical protein
LFGVKRSNLCTPEMPLFSEFYRTMTITKKLWHATKKHAPDIAQCFKACKDLRDPCYFAKLLTDLNSIETKIITDASSCGSIFWSLQAKSAKQLINDIKSGETVKATDIYNIRNLISWFGESARSSLHSGKFGKIAGINWNNLTFYRLQTVGQLNSHHFLDPNKCNSVMKKIKSSTDSLLNATYFVDECGGRGFIGVAPKRVPSNSCIDYIDKGTSFASIFSKNLKISSSHAEQNALGIKITGDIFLMTYRLNADTSIFRPRFPDAQANEYWWSKVVSGFNWTQNISNPSKPKKGRREIIHGMVPIANLVTIEHLP